MSTEADGLPVPAQTIPIPRSISEEARAFLAMATARILSGGGAEPAGDPAEPALAFLRPRAAAFAGTVEDIALPGGALLYRVVPETMAGRRAEVAYFDVHGGGFVTGGGEMCRILAMLRALDFGVTVYAIDYRLAPQHPYPAALDDTLAAYREVLRRVPAGDLVVAGSSAGGNLAAALMLRAAESGLPLPAALVLMTPVTDLTGTGDSRQTNRFLDVTLHGGADDTLAGYVGSADPAHPHLSPIYGDIPAGWPPTLLSSGTRDLLLSDTVRLHRALRRAGVAAELHVTEGGPHGGFMGTAPEDQELIGEVRRFCDEAWGI